jgi:hypothetical protein
MSPFKIVVFLILGGSELAADRPGYLGVEWNLPCEVAMRRLREAGIPLSESSAAGTSPRPPHVFATRDGGLCPLAEADKYLVEGAAHHYEVFSGVSGGQKFAPMCRAGKFVGVVVTAWVDDVQESACLYKAAGRESESRLNACISRRDDYCGVRYSAQEQRGGAARYLEREDAVSATGGTSRQLIRYTVLSKQEDDIIRGAERACETRRGSRDAGFVPPGAAKFVPALNEEG